MARSIISTLACISLSLVSLNAYASPSEVSDTPDPATPAITGGQSAATCAWPTTVAVTSGGGLCSGTLVHPQVVVYAAHCGASGQTSVTMGESSWGGALNLNPDFCMINPNYGGVSDPGNDWAFCKLSSAVQIPVTPPLMGCEYAALEYGAEVAIAGFGNTSESGGAGTKRWALTHTAGVNLDANIGEAGGMGGDPAACQGDSGGPAFVRLADGGWRTWGIVSTGTTCGSGVNYSLISGAVGWIESSSGVDITPCFTAEGVWDASAQCTGFNASEPGASFGSWNGGCVGGPTTGAANTCGPTWDAPPDTTPPTVSITSPTYGTVFPDDPSTINIDIDAFDADWGIREVRLEIDGADVGADTTEPYGFASVTFPKGTYELVAVATDHADQVTYSAPVVIGVAEDDIPDPPMDTGTSGDSGDASGSADDSGGDSFTASTGDEGLNLDESGSGEGCACAADKDTPTGWGALALLGLLGLRRRR